MPLGLHRARGLGGGWRACLRRASLDHPIVMILTCAGRLALVCVRLPYVGAPSRKYTCPRYSGISQRAAWMRQVFPRQGLEIAMPAGYHAVGDAGASVQCPVGLSS